MDKETALQAWKQMRSEIDPDNWLFVGTINLEMVDRAIEALEAVIKADANLPEIPDSWIPVSERLPQSDPEDLEYPTVIICSPNGSVELGCFYESTKEWGAGENFDRLRNPVAWMPLPEPYMKGEQHETD